MDPPTNGPMEAEVELQPHVDLALARMNIECAVVSSVRDCHFSVSIADPLLPDAPIIAVSEGFCELTGYGRETVVGRNCRFLNEGCDLRPADREGLREAAKTGRHFCALLPNRKADGTAFMNLLDMRGLAVGKNLAGEERWFIIGIQADVTEQGAGELPLEHKLQMQCIAEIVREELLSPLQEAAIVSSESLEPGNAITPYPEPRWIIGEVAEELPCFGG